MPSTLISMDYFATYYFANICEKVLDATFDFARTLDDFWSSLELRDFEPFKKYSLLHSYIDFTVDRIIWEDFWCIDFERIGNKPDFYINRMLRHHSIQHESFEVWRSRHPACNDEFPEDPVNEYYQFIQELDRYSEVFDQIVNEVFFVLFLNRKFLKDFNEYLAEVLKTWYLTETGKTVFKRSHIPQWVKDAVYHRDRWRCVICRKDLSWTLSIANKRQYDHIVPLARNGINDVSNIQLLCNDCNNKKGAKCPVTSTTYEAWY